MPYRMKPPKVSICIITYNQEKYIAQAMDSALMQETDFEVEIVIGEDCSTDGTAEIVKTYARKHPDMIRLLPNTENLGMIGNWARTVEACRGDYIALLEGDDFWTDKIKIQLQADDMDKRGEASLCFHKVDFITEEGVKQDDTYLNQELEERDYNIKDVIEKPWFIGTCSIMFRRSCLPSFPSWVKKLKAIDKVVQLICADQGPIAYINREMGTYRIHPMGISQVQWLGRENRFELTVVDIFRKFDQHTKKKHHEQIRQRLIGSYKALMAKNPPRSAIHRKALWRLIRLDKNSRHLIKEYMITSIIPGWLYRFYSKLKGRKHVG